MTTTINLEEIKTKLYERLKPSGWGDLLKVFLMGEEMDKILSVLYAEVQEGRHFTPPLKLVFRAFEECPYRELKVVTMAQDVYPYPNVCDGIPFSCGIENKPMASLKYIHKEIKDTVYPNDSYDYPTSLVSWSNQGILMLNAGLTTQMNKVGTHYAVWRPFITFVLDMINAYNPGMIYVFFGKVAQQFMTGLPDNNYKLIASHPASAAHNKAERWDSGDVFNKVNEILYKNNGLKIKW